MPQPTIFRRIGSRHGAMLVLIAICLPLFLIMAAFAVDVAWMQLVRAELRTATDAAARAGAKELSLSQNEAAARARAKEVALRNEVAGEGLVLTDAEIEVGRATQTGFARFQFTPGGERLNAMRVTGKRTSGSAAGPVNLLFAGVLGIDIFEPQHVATSAQLDRDICLVVDRSGSMMMSLQETGGLGNTRSNSAALRSCDPPSPNSRWVALDAAVEAFLVELTKTPANEQVGLCSYSSNLTDCGRTYLRSNINSDLEFDYSIVRNEMRRIGSAPVKGATAITAGIDEGIRVLTGARIRPFAVKTMVLMTDGLHNQGPPPITAARRAAARGLTIHTITFSEEADQRQMQEVAELTGGKHFHAPDAKTLLQIFKEIAATLPVLLTE